jgi:hypothetical protein
VDENTIVFNNIAQSIGEMERSWEGPACESWHANLAP